MLPALVLESDGGRLGLGVQGCPPASVGDTAERDDLTIFGELHFCIDANHRR